MKRRIDILKEHQENINNIECELLSYRCFGEPKLSKPKILKGLKPIKSFDLIKKKVNVFDLGNGELVLYFGTLFSKLASFPEKEDMTLPTSALAEKYQFNKGSYKNFIYPDAWCSIYDRNEGYILVKGILACFNELYCINLPIISNKLYSCIRGLSMKDSRFLHLGLVPIGADSCDYSRLCDDIVHWLYKEKRNYLKELLYGKN